MIQFPENIFQMGWCNHRLVILDDVFFFALLTVNFQGLRLQH